MVRKWALIGCLALLCLPAGCGGKKETADAGNSAAANPSPPAASGGETNGEKSSPSGGAAGNSSSSNRPVAQGGGEPAATPGSGKPTANAGGAGPSGGNPNRPVAMGGGMGGAGGSNQASAAAGSGRPSVSFPGGNSGNSAASLGGGDGTDSASIGGSDGASAANLGSGPAGANSGSTPSQPSPPPKLSFQDRANLAFAAGNTKRAYHLLQAHGLMGSEEQAAEVATQYRWAPKAKRPQLGLNIAVGLVLKNPNGVTDLKPIGTDLQSIMSGANLGGRAGGGGPSMGGPSMGGPSMGGPSMGGPGMGGGSSSPVAGSVPAKALAGAAGVLAEKVLEQLSTKHESGAWSEAFRNQSLSNGPPSIPLGGGEGFAGGGAAPTGGGPSVGFSGGGGPPAGYAGGGASAPPGYGGGGGGPPAGYAGGGGNSAPPGYGGGGGGPPAGYAGGGGNSAPPGYGGGGGGPPAGYTGGGGSSAPPGYGGGGGGPPAGYTGGGGGSMPPGSTSPGKSNFHFRQEGSEGMTLGGADGASMIGGPSAGVGGPSSSRPGISGPGGPGIGGIGGGNDSFAPPVNLGPDFKLPQGIIPLAACVNYIGADDAAKLIKKAYEEQYDALILFEVEVAQNRQTRVVNNTARVRVVVPAESAKEAKAIAASKQLVNVSVARSKTKNENDGVEDAAELIAKKLAEEVGLKEIPDKLTPEIVVGGRLPRLIKEEGMTSLEKVAEVNFYFAKGFIDEATRDDYFEKVGGNSAKALVSGSQDQRENALEKMLDE